MNTIKPKTGSRKKEQVRTANGTFSAKLTRKQKAFADMIISQPKTSATEIVRQTYNVSDTNTAKSIASENLTKPNIVAYIDEHVTKARDKIVSLLEAEKEEIQLRSAQDILDRTLGKATQRTEVRTEKLSINIDLTGTLEE